MSVNIPADKARAVVAALEQEMGTTLATKSDVALLQQEIGALRDSTKKDLLLLQQGMTLRLGGMFVVGMSLLFAALKLT